MTLEDLKKEIDSLISAFELGINGNGESKDESDSNDEYDVIDFESHTFRYYTRSKHGRRVWEVWVKGSNKPGEPRCLGSFSDPQSASDLLNHMEQFADLLRDCGEHHAIGDLKRRIARRIAEIWKMENQI